MPKQGFSVEIDLSDMERGLKKLVTVTSDSTKRGLSEVGEELLRVSRQEVPLDKGPLSESGTVDNSELTKDEPAVIVGYNKVYAARLHEHPEYRFQHGRKGKYLEDPLKQNAGRFAKHIAEAVRGAL